MNSKKEKTIDDYIKSSKISFSFPIMLMVILFIVVLISKYYILLYFELFILIVIMDWMNERNNICSIKKYLVKHNLINEIGFIYFWNENDCMLTDNYFILMVLSKVIVFKYEDIDSIYKKTKANKKLFHFTFKINGFDDYLYICLKNGQEYRLLIGSTIVRSEKLMDISEYLLSKNPKIKFIDE